MSDPRSAGPVGIWSAVFDQLPIEHVRRLARDIEAAGWSSVWFGESRGREAFAQAALLLGETSRVAVGAGVASIFARTAATSAKGQWSLSEAYPGRFTMGLGVSHPESVMANHGSEYPRRPLAEFSLYLDAMKVAPWTPPRPAGTRTVIAALGPKMLDLAASRAIGTITFFSPPTHTAACRAALGRGADVIAVQAAILDDDPKSARYQARALTRVLFTYRNYRRNLVRLGFSEAELEDGGTDRVIDALFAHGGAEDVARRVDEQFAAGASEVAVNVLVANSGDVSKAWSDLAAILAEPRQGAG